MEGADGFSYNGPWEGGAGSTNSGGVGRRALWDAESLRVLVEILERTENLIGEALDRRGGRSRGSVSMVPALVHGEDAATWPVLCHGFAQESTFVSVLKVASTFLTVPWFASNAALVLAACDQMTVEPTSSA
jgi:hypothetical protein